MLVVVFHDAKSVGRFLAPEILKRFSEIRETLILDVRKYNINDSLIHALIRSSGLCGVKLRISFTA